MTKEDSSIMKGCAILFMVYLHLFNSLGNADLCQNYIYIDNLPLTYIISRATNPVSFFLILSGYGLYIVQSKNEKFNVLEKIKNLYIHYWISLLIFVPIGALIVGTNIYPGPLISIILIFLHGILTHGMPKYGFSFHIYCWR